MRNPTTRKVFGSLLTATFAGALALSMMPMPQVDCEAGDCVESFADYCWDGQEFIFGYKSKISIDG